jgi:pSer/pThr/pTyr-binding forkhead associated (FHA) protein
MDLTPEQLLSRVVRADAVLVGPGGATVGIADGVRIGRDRATCEVAVLHASVSAVHARIARDQLGWYVADLGSRNGTAVDGKSAAPVSYLRPGAQLRLGDVVLGFAHRSRSPRVVTIESDDGRRFELSSSEAAIRCDDGAIVLAPRELELVIALVARRCTLSPEQAYVRGSELAPTLGFHSIEPDDENVRELVLRVRKKLRSIGGDQLIETRRSAGYRLRGTLEAW